MMRALLFCILFLAPCLVFGKSNDPSLTVNTSGVATICFPKDSSWSINLQQFRWNKWVLVRRMDVQKEKDTCFTMPVDLHSGENLFRIVILDRYGKPMRYEQGVRVMGPSFVQTSPAETYGQGDTISLARVSMWEFYDEWGNAIRTGKSQEIAVRGLYPGTYYFCYDNYIVEIRIYAEEHRPG